MGEGCLLDALCLRLFPCCTTVGAAASSAIMKGHWSVEPSFTPTQPSLTLPASEQGTTAQQKLNIFPMSGYYFQ